EPGKPRRARVADGAMPRPALNDVENCQVVTVQRLRRVFRCHGETPMALWGDRTTRLRSEVSVRPADRFCDGHAVRGHRRRAYAGAGWKSPLFCAMTSS